MKNVIIFGIGVVLMTACSDPDTLMPAYQMKHSGARPINPSVPNIEPWGGVTLTPYPISGPVQYYYANWAGVPLVFDREISYMIGSPIGQPAYGTITNGADLASMGVSVEVQPQIGSSYYFRLLQMNTGTGGFEGAKRKAMISASEAVASIIASTGTYYSDDGTAKGEDIKPQVVDAIKQLRDSYVYTYPDVAVELDNIKTNVQQGSTKNDVVKSDNFSYTITGRLVVKPGQSGQYGIVPVTWTPVYLPF